MTQYELEQVVKIIERNMTTIYDRPLGSNPRWVLTTFGLEKAKKEIESELVEKIL